MTGDESRGLKIGDRVSWAGSLTDLGSVKSNGWGGVVIDWDDGHTSSIHHNDMKEIERVPMKGLRDILLIFQKMIGRNVSHR